MCYRNTQNSLLKKHHDHRYQVGPSVNVAEVVDDIEMSFHPRIESTRVFREGDEADDEHEDQDDHEVRLESLYGATDPLRLE